MVRSSLLSVALGRPWPVRQTLGRAMPSIRGICVPPCPLCLGANRRLPQKQRRALEARSQTEVWWLSTFRAAACLLLCISVFREPPVGRLGAEGRGEETGREGVIIRVM